MKKSRILLLLVTVVTILVGASAFSVFTVSKPKAAVEDQLYWFDENGMYTGNHRVKSLELTSSCPDGSGDICERGYDGNDFVIPDDPSSGLNGSATVNEVIKKP